MFFYVLWGGALDKQLRELYKSLQSSEMAGAGEEEDDQMAMMGFGELRPYVFIPLMAGFE